MFNEVLTFISLILPILSGVLCLAMQVFIKRAEDISKFQFSVFGFVTFESHLRKLWLIRTFLLLLAILLFIIPIFRDYADLFPHHMQMGVFFDDDGIKESLAQFDEKELAEIGLSENWINEKQAYVDSLNKVLAEIKNPFRFENKKGTVISKGENYIQVARIRGWALQRYRITAGKGSLLHTHEVPSDTTKEPGAAQTITSRFELLETENNYITLSLADIYWNWQKVIKPEYKQVFRFSPDKEIYNNSLIALTRVRFFPYTDIGTTVYLLRQKDGNKYIPIGYAIYYPD